MQSLNTIAKGAGFVFIGMILSKLFTYVYRVIVARIGTAEYGALSLALAVFGIAGIISLLGLHIGVVRYTAHYKALHELEKAKGALTSGVKVALLVSSGLGVALFLLADWIAIALFHTPETGLYLKILAFMLPLYAVRDLIMSAVKAFTERSDFDVFSRNVLENFLKVIVTAILVWLGYSVLGAVWAVVVGIVMTFLLSLYYGKLYLPYSKLKSIENKLELIKYSFPLLLTTLLIQVLLWTDVMMIGFYRTTSDVGIYNAALPTATLMSIIPGGIIALFLPVITRLIATGKTSEFKVALVQCTKWIWFLNVPVFFVLFVFPSELLGLIFGADYVAGASVMMMLVFAYLIFQTMQPWAETLNALKKTKLVFFNTFVAAIANVGLNMWLIPKYGLIGGGIATSVSFIVYGFLGGVEGWYYSRVNVLNVGLLKAVVAGILAVLIAWWVNQIGGVSGYLLALVVFGVVYVALVLLFKSLDEKDIAVLKSFKKKVFG